jgi:hypothetical protein
VPIKWEGIRHADAFQMGNRALLYVGVKGAIIQMENDQLQ